MVINLEEAKIQLRIIDDSSDDFEILSCIDSAIDIVEKHIDKVIVISLVDVEQALIDSGKVIVLSAGLRQAILIMITHLFETASLVSDDNLKVVPMSYRYILDQYRTPVLG